MEPDNTVVINESRNTTEGFMEFESETNSSGDERGKEFFAVVLMSDLIEAIVQSVKKLERLALLRAFIT